MHLISKLFTKLFKLLYWPICRAYARHLRHLGDRPADAVLRCLCIPQYLMVYRCWPNFVHPRRFTEKVWSRQLHDRDPKLPLIMDKFRVRDYVAGKGGSDYLVPLLWSGDKPEEIPFDKLPLKFVIKTNHGCDYNIIVLDRKTIDQSEIRRLLKKWLGPNPGQVHSLGIAWGYYKIRPTIIIESFIGENDKAPDDYKFFCFSGRVEFLKIDFDRFEGHAEKFFDRDLNRLDLVERGLKQYQGKIDLPDNIKDMIRVAESLSEGFDFIRVDLYNVKNKIYFGEFTPYPGGVSAKFEPDSFDYVFGEKWK
jgi:hypothetical protein